MAAKDRDLIIENRLKKNIGKAVDIFHEGLSSRGTRAYISSVRSGEAEFFTGKPGSRGEKSISLYFPISRIVGVRIFDIK